MARAILSTCDPGGGEPRPEMGDAPPPPNNKTSPLLHIGTILGGFSIGGWGGLVSGGGD